MIQDNMRLSTILELLLILLLIAFAAYGRIIERNNAIGKKKNSDTQSSSISLKQTTDTVNKYCICNENICNCCRDFHIPLVQLSGPGCASLQYLRDDRLAMQLSIGDNILSSNIINGKNPKPVCVALPGGFSKFCGKIYSIKREADKHFKACLGLELRSATELEASLRVSCFRFGPDGLKLRPAEPIPVSLTESPSTSDDDYDDFFNLDDDDDDDEDEDDDDGYEKVSPENNAISALTTSEHHDPEQDEDEDDLLGLGALFDILTGSDDSSDNKKSKLTTSTSIATPIAIPLLTLTSTLVPNNDEFSVTKSPTSFSSTITTTLDAAAVPFTVSHFDIHKNSSELNKTTKLEKNITHHPTEKTVSSKTTKLTYEATTPFDIGVTEKENNAVESINTIKNKYITKDTDMSKLKKTKNQNKKKINHNLPSLNAIVSHDAKPQDIHQGFSNSSDLVDYNYSDSLSDEDDDYIEDSGEEVYNIHGEKNVTDKQTDVVETITKSEGDYEQDDDDDDDIEVSEEEDEEEEEVEDSIISALIEDDQKKERNHEMGRYLNRTDS